MELVGPDSPTTRWSLRGSLAGRVDELGWLPGERSDLAEGHLILDGTVDSDGQVELLALRGVGGSLDGPRRAAILSGLGRGVSIPAPGRRFGFSARVGAAASSGNQLTLLADDEAPPPSVADWPDDDRRSLSASLAGCVPEQFRAGSFRTRMELVAAPSGEGWNFEVDSLLPEAFTTRLGRWFGALDGLMALPACVDAIAAAPPPGLAGRRLRLSVLLSGTAPVPEPARPENPSSLDDILVGPSALSVSADDVRVLYTSDHADVAHAASRTISSLVPSIRSCDSGLLASSALLQASSRIRAVLGPAGAEIDVVSFVASRHLALGPGREHLPEADRLVTGCITEILEGTRWPDVGRLVILELPMTFSSTPIARRTPPANEVEAVRVATSALLPAHLRLATCDNRMNDQTTNSPLRTWYAEVTADGSLSEFVPRLEPPINPRTARCLAEFREFARPPATGFAVRIDPWGHGPDLGSARPAETAGEDARTPIGSTFRIGLPAAKECYEAVVADGGLPGAPGETTKLVLSFTVLAHGAISRLQVDSHEPEADLLADCIAKVWVDLPWPAPADDVEVESYPMFFSMMQPESERGSR